MNPMKSWMIQRAPQPGDPHFHEPAIRIVSRLAPKYCPACGADLEAATLHVVCEVVDDDVADAFEREDLS